MNTCFSPLYKSLLLVINNPRQLSLATTTAFIASLACAPALAANGDALNLDANSPHITLPTTTITATRSPAAINNTIAQTRVIKSEDLKHFQGQTALDVIKRQPGFNFKQTGGMGTSSNFYVRGYDNKQILVLIDGVPFRSLSTGEPALNLISSDQIDRIEILYGASGTSIYGADAMGGVIQVFTKGYNGDQSQFSVTAGAGSHDHYQYGASAQFNSDSGTRLSLSANRNETKGYNATFIDHPWGIYNPDDDGFESNNYSLRLDQKINDDINVGISGLYSDSETEFDNGLTNGQDNTLAKQKNGAAQAYANWRYMPGSNLKLAYGHSIDKSDNPTYASYYNTKQDQISLVGQHALPVGTAIYGAEHLKQKLDSNQYQTDDRKVTSGFLGYLVSYDNIDAQANVRYDDYSDFDDKTTYNLGAAYRFTSDFRIGANYAKGYRVPTFGDLYAWGGDPNLKPETSDNYEAFVDYTTVNQTTRLTGYINKLDDMIAGDENYQRKNYTKAKIEGVTFTTDWNIDDYLFGLSYDYQEAKDDGDKQDKGNYLPNRPKHKGLIYAGYQLADLDLRAEYEYVGHYYYDGTNNDKADNYGLVNISGNYQLSPNLSLSARLNNVFNKKYVTSPGYSTDDGTNFFTSLTYTWQ